MLVNDSMHRDPNQIVKDAVFLAPGRLHGVQREGSNSQGQSYRLQGVHCAVQPVCSPANLSKSKGHVKVRRMNVMGVEQKCSCDSLPAVRVPSRHY